MVQLLRPAPAGPLAPFDDDEVSAIGAGSMVVRDGLLPPELALACAAEARELEAAGRLSPAHIGRDRALRPNIRGDHTGWFAELDLPPALSQLWALFELLRLRLNEDLWLGLRRFELQLACYEAGARYAAHRDTFAQDPTRRLTAIVYLNPGWRPEHGGELVAWTPGGPASVAPVLGRLVLFLSDQLVHEVRPAHEPRFAATAWYRASEAVPLLPDHPAATGQESR